MGQEHGTVETGWWEANRQQSVARHPGPKVVSIPVNYTGKLSDSLNAHFLIHKDMILMPTSYFVLEIEAVNIHKANFGTHCLAH